MRIRSTPILLFIVLGFAVSTALLVGGTKEQAAIEPPEKETDYPEPARFGDTPAYRFYIPHVRDLEISDVQVGYAKPDQRPPFALSDVHGGFRACQDDARPRCPDICAERC